MYQQQFMGEITVKTSICKFVNLLRYFSNNKIQRDDLDISFLANYDEREIIKQTLVSIYIRKQGGEFIIKPSLCHSDYRATICLLNSGEGEYSEAVLTPNPNIDVSSLDYMYLECETYLMIDVNYKGKLKTSIDQTIYVLRDIIEEIEKFCKVEGIHIMTVD